jgi:hypothetical protein
MGEVVVDRDAMKDAALLTAPLDALELRQRLERAA